tara:strand:- start:134 stop:427 length:294 start_codon:yes stop_codon:yes gene_type:complete
MGNLSGLVFIEHFKGELLCQKYEQNQEKLNTIPTPKKERQRQEPPAVELMLEKNESERCVNCGCTKPKVWVHGHYQCADCKCVTDGDCCQGESESEK